LIPNLIFIYPLHLIPFQQASGLVDRLLGRGGKAKEVGDGSTAAGGGGADGGSAAAAADTADDYMARKMAGGKAKGKAEKGAKSRTRGSVGTTRRGR
jgi:hypothetical protein